MLGLFGSPFFSNPFYSFNADEARLMNLMHTIFNDDEEFGFSKPENDKKEEPTETSKTFSSIKQSFLNGPHMIEEVRERSVNSNTGEKSEVTTRRLGNKWVKIETLTDKDGKTTTKESWHNVSENQEEEFKKKWEEHRGSFGFEGLKDEFTSKKALKHE